MRKRHKVAIVVLVAVLVVGAVTLTVSAGGPGGRFGGFWKRGAGPRAGEDALAEALGMDSVDDLHAALKEGKTLAELAEEAGVDLQELKATAGAERQAAVRAAIEKAVEEGALSQERADQILERLESGVAPRGGMRPRGGGVPGFGFKAGPGWAGSEALAEALGMTPDELSARLQEGATLADLAEAQDTTLDEVMEALRAAREDAMRAAIEQGVADGKISEERAEWMLKGLEEGFMGGRGMPGADCAGPYQGFRGRGESGGMRRPGGFGRFPKREPAPDPDATSI